MGGKKKEFPEENLGIFVRKKHYDKLIKKYPAMIGVIDKKIESWCKFYNKKPFQEKEKAIYLAEIKDDLILFNSNYKEPKKKAGTIYTKKGQAETFNELQPVFYDRAGLFWLWDNEEKKWSLSDEVDILNMIQEETNQDIISSKNRTEIINSLKQEGRKNIPKPIKKTWVQFKYKIYDIETGESFEATPEYFVTNPIPHNVSGDPKTPTMDKIFTEWVGEEYKETLYQILAYCLLPDYPIHRLFCLIGGGMNGKSKFLELLRKFVGKTNVCSTELDTLINSRFEVTRLHKKLVCQMGETNFNEMNKTSILKKLTGGDLIGFEYKRKDPFEEENYAKIIIATNNLPTTTDKTIGFYRRWMIIDFPNQFSEKKDILNDIPEKEFDNLATNSIIVLNELLKNKEFSKEGSIEERMKKYEDHSDPLEKFLKEFTTESYEGYIWKSEFERKLNEWCKGNRYREMSAVVIGKKMKEKGIEQQQKYEEWMSKDYGKKGGRAWVGIQWKEMENTYEKTR
jgi:putative DNA primase/helicase|tara:strand:- start:96 stop:1628 length:1533 start_codon:yes stop_codon:yes gene_type:complete